MINAQDLPYIGAGICLMMIFSTANLIYFSRMFYKHKFTNGDKYEYYMERFTIMVFIKIMEVALIFYVMVYANL